MKVKYGIITLIVIFMLTGCISESKRNDILKQLQKNEYIMKDWVQIDTYTKNDPGNDIPVAVFYDYLYKDNNNNYYVVRIDNTSRRNEYTIHVFYGVTYIGGTEQLKYSMANINKRVDINMKYKRFLIFGSWHFEDSINEF